MAQEINTVQPQTPATREAGQRMASRPVFMPAADIYETKDSIVVLAEMPGVSPDGVDISLERRVLRVGPAHQPDGGGRVAFHGGAAGRHGQGLAEPVGRVRVPAGLGGRRSRPWSPR